MLCITTAKYNGLLTFDTVCNTLEIAVELAQIAISKEVSRFYAVFGAPVYRIEGHGMI